MEDAATAEICRSQVWQWVRHGSKLQRWPARDARDGAQGHRREKNQLTGARMAKAAEIYEEMMTTTDFAEFLTLVAYDYID